MTTTVKELVARITNLQHRRAVYQSVADFLTQHLNRDIGDPKQIVVDGCPVAAVSQEVIEAVLEEEVYSAIELIETELNALLSASIATKKVADELPQRKRRRSPSPRAKPESRRAAV